MTPLTLMTRPNIARALILAATAASLLATSPSLATAQGGRYALVVQGASGEEQYATLHRGWLDSLCAVLRDRFKYDAAHLTVLAEQPQTGEERATAESVKATLVRLSRAMAPADQLIVVLIGHGSTDAADAKFNLIGPDLTVTQWKDALQPIKGRLAIVDTTAASFPYMKGLAAPGRVVITATNSPAQRFATNFPQQFIAAFTDDTADLDKDGRISLLEAFSHASRAVKQYYEQKGLMATEVAVLDDNGDGAGRDATVTTGPDGALAALTYFNGVGAPTSSDPETQRLLKRQQELTEQIDDLRRRRGTIQPDEFDKEFERLALELATVSRDVRRRTPGN
ncbi:MAG: hypothetical protein ABI051_11230 [Vicinamibacterales bacterium]